MAAPGPIRRASVPLSAEPVRALRRQGAEKHFQDAYARGDVYFLNFAYTEALLPRKIRPSAMWITWLNRMSQYAVQQDAPAYPIKAGCRFLRYAEAYPFWVNSEPAREILHRMAVLAGCARPTA
ncbi:hypothetical protein BU251_08005 [Candidatus Velamenicoccus archaeovorus]|uniref:Uncharacterized protein n=1 Tax=Velamenicoccus archaeovorus TaxID=1930593 RepID=A0A410P646_VELA1|nr:hypothetical protein BU251_08005 [Candidatus Velamenicoccus archaeovorus]